MSDTPVLAKMKIDGGSFELTATHLQQYREGGAVGEAISGSVRTSGLGLIGGAILGGIGGAVKALSKDKPHGDPIPLSRLRLGRGFANEKKKGCTFVLAFFDGKESDGIYVETLEHLEKFVAQLNEQIKKVRSAPPSTVAPPLAGSPVALDPRVPALPGWETLPQWSLHKVQDDVLHLPIPPTTTEQLFVRSKAEVQNGTVRFAYRSLTATGGYLSVRLRSDGKTWAVIRVNPKGEYQVNTHAQPGKWIRDALLSADPQHWNEVRIDMAGSKLALWLNGGLAAVADGMTLPTGRVVLTGSAAQGAEFAVRGFEIYPPSATAPPLPSIHKEGTLVFDIKDKNLTGWNLLPQWSPASLEGNPADVRLKIANEGNTEAQFFRTRDELKNCRITLRYSFPVVQRFAYLAVRVRSDGKSFGLLRLNNKGEMAVSATPAIGNAWTKVTALHTDKPNEVVIEISDKSMKVIFNGTQSIVKEGLELASGRIVIQGGADPKPAEISIGELAVTPT